jgi:hypothetical protein
MKDSSEESGVGGSLPPLFPTSWAEAVLEYVRQPSGVAARSSKVESNSKEQKSDDLYSVVVHNSFGESATIDICT